MTREDVVGRVAEVREWAEAQVSATAHCEQGDDPDHD